MNFHQMKYYIAEKTGLPTKLIHDCMTDMVMFLDDDSGKCEREFSGPWRTVKVIVSATPSGDVWNVI